MAIPFPYETGLAIVPINPFATAYHCRKWKSWNIHIYASLVAKELTYLFDFSSPEQSCAQDLVW